MQLFQLLIADQEYVYYEKSRQNSSREEKGWQHKKITAKE